MLTAALTPSLTAVDVVSMFEGESQSDCGYGLRLTWLHSQT